MIGFKRQMTAFVVGAAAFAAAPISMAQQTSGQVVQLSPEQMLEAARLSLRDGDAGRALAFADALLMRDPQDVKAHLVRAHALRAQARYGEAQDAARAGWRYAASDDEKFSAALLMAQALSSDGKRTRAQLWLRRAKQVAPTPGHEARAARDFKYVQRRNPWQTHLSLSFAPNSNINNGSARDSYVQPFQLVDLLDTDGTGETKLGPASKALSGFEFGGAVQSRYRFHQTENSAHDIRFGLSYRTYTLSQNAKDDLADFAEQAAPGSVPRKITGSDYAYGTAQIGYGYKRLRDDRRGEFSLNADVGQSFYGGARYTSYLRGSVGQSFYASKATKYNVSLRAGTHTGQRGFDHDRASLTAGMSRKLSNGDGLYLGATVGVQRSDTDRIEYDELRLRSGYVLGRPVMGSAVQMGLSTSYRDYDSSPYDPSGRRDFQVAADVTATFSQIDYYGFNPTLSLTASTTNSNIGLFDVNRLGLSIGIASAF